MATVIKLRNATTTQWSSSTRIIAKGELAIDTTLNKIKIGDGTKTYAQLAYSNVTPTELAELSQDAIAAAFAQGNHTNITVTYDDDNNKINLATGPDVVTLTSLTNTLTDPSGGYVPISDVAQPDGVASLDSNGFVPDAQILSSITRNDVAQSLTNKTIGLGTGITSAAGYDDITGFFGQSNIAIYQAGIDKGGRINISSGGVITIANSGIGYISGIVTTSGGTRFTITVGGNALTGTLAEFNAALTDGDFATETYVNTAVSNLVDSAPSTLNTLNEIAAAINDDASYASTITTALGNKEPLLPSQTGNSGKFLTTDGTDKSWATVSQYSLPTQTGNSGKFLTTNGSAESWAVIQLPSQATFDTLGTVYSKVDLNSTLGFGQSVLQQSTGYGNSAFGVGSMLGNTSGNRNTAFGAFTISQNSTGYGNTAVGTQTLYSTTSNNNSAFGAAALRYTTTGDANSAFGKDSMVTNTSGYGNAAFGMQSLYSNLSGNSNSSFGYDSLVNSTGNQNVAIGHSSGSTLTSGDNNIGIGYNAQFSSTTISNQITLGNSSITTFRIPGLSVNWSTSAYGRATYASTSAPSGGNDGDVWLVYTA